jgi:hypothetical protein
MIKDIFSCSNLNGIFESHPANSTEEHKIFKLLREKYQFTVIRLIAGKSDRLKVYFVKRGCAC